MKYSILFTIFSLLTFSTCKAQNAIQLTQKFDSIFYSKIHSKQVFNYQRYINYAKSEDARKFIALSYGVNALNIMYETTGDIKYLEVNKEIIKNLLQTAQPLPLQWKKEKQANLYKEQPAFKGWVVKANAPKQVLGRDWQLYEGYLYRYIAQYLYILKKDHLIIEYPEFKNSYFKMLDFMENDIWEKWKRRSILKKGNLSAFYSGRTHMGSHWAVIALYLSKISTDKTKTETYETVIANYDKLLKNNFQLKIIHEKEYYIWHATYDSLAGDSTLNKMVHYTKESRWQDVSHGNQVVDYIITACELGNPRWGSIDIERLINTVKYVTWKPQNKSFKDNFKGRGTHTKLTGIGWKQSDGWLKLAAYDKDLQKIYWTYYTKRKDFIDKTFLSVQFWAQLAFNCIRSKD